LVTIKAEGVAAVKNINDPRQGRLFDEFEEFMHPKAYQKLKQGWQHLFRESIRELMPVDVVGGEFSDECGQPTKELYSMCGLILIMEFMDWTTKEAVDNYIYRGDIHYALNLESAGTYVSERSIYRYKNLMIENDLAAQIMTDVTRTLVEKLNLKIGKQRLDSTHLESDMAKFGRTQLMSTAIKRFLTQLKRHDLVTYDELDAELRKRYEKSPYQLFGGKKKSDDDRQLLRIQIAKDMYELIVLFGENEGHNRRKTFTDLVLIFDQQCEITPSDDSNDEAIIEIRKHPGGDVIQNPSDPDATYDGKKGPGFQVQLSETCDEDNEVQLITTAIPEKACESDANAMEPVLENLKANDLLPGELSADTAYGSDDNQQRCETEGIELVSPVPGKKIDASQTGAADFEEAPGGEVLCCPMRCKSLMSTTAGEADATLVIMNELDCCNCVYLDTCPVEKDRRGRYAFKYTSKERRLDARRRYEATSDFREKYRIRSGIEATNSVIKRVTGLARLRVRGRPAVFHSILLKIAGWNILQAARALSLRAKRLAQQLSDEIHETGQSRQDFFAIFMFQPRKLALPTPKTTFIRPYPSKFSLLLKSIA
jgi:hypothetical protein